MDVWSWQEYSAYFLRVEECWKFCKRKCFSCRHAIKTACCQITKARVFLLVACRWPPAHLEKQQNSHPAIWLLVVGYLFHPHLVAVTRRLCAKRTYAQNDLVPNQQSLWVCSKQFWYYFGPPVFRSISWWWWWLLLNVILLNLTAFCALVGFPLVMVYFYCWPPEDLV